MAAKGKDAKDKGKDKGPKAKKARKPASSRYEISGSSIKKKNKECPKCGKGTFMAAHKDRHTCGKCGYMEKK
ncbi:30S ribosomal protein S27ae [Candidatus Woesearchaeota archaeon]|nr:30S ribosomal protein S27ae [Candidatus Woesearchaeota archaeon]